MLPHRRCAAGPFGTLCATRPLFPAWRRRKRRGHDRFAGAMTNYVKLPTWADKDHVYAVVETPRGSRVKLEFDPKLGAFTLAKPLFAGLTYPYDWGFIPSTQADDGDPLDVLIIHDAATYPGLVLRCTPVGVLEVEQSSKGKKERNDRVFVVPDRSPFEGDLQASGGCRRAPSRSWRNSSWPQTRSKRRH
jgi:inorganic pyrophosphatase